VVGEQRTGPLVRGAASRVTVARMVRRSSGSATRATNRQSRGDRPTASRWTCRSNAVRASCESVSGSAASTRWRSAPSLASESPVSARAPSARASDGAGGVEEQQGQGAPCRSNLPGNRTYGRLG
jgi:hypothetical protein